MRIDDCGPALKRIRFGMIEPDLRERVLEVALSLGHEGTVSAETDLQFLLRLYMAESAKEKGRKRALKKASDLIMRLSSLHYEAHEREMERKRRERKDRPFPAAAPAEMPISKKAMDLFASIGITDQRAMAHVLDFLGEKKLEGRVELVLSSALPSSAAKGVFGAKPELLLKVDDREFAMELEAMEAKREIIDHRYADVGMGEPIYLRYPEILAESYHEVARIMDLKPVEEKAEPAPAEEEKRQKFRVNPIHPNDFIKVLRGLGFELKSSGPHRVLAHEDGRVSVVQSAHGANREFGPGLIRMKLRESGITVEEFQRKREELGV